jgi:hypothetical protein
MSIFLSYAREDEIAAGVVSRWLHRLGFQVFDWTDPALRGQRFARKIEEQLGMAEAFFALVSPHYFASPWCNWERELALHRATDLQGTNPNRRFIYVLQAAEVLHSDAGFLRTYDWYDISQEDRREESLQHLRQALRVPEGSLVTPDETASTSSGGQPALWFRNRHLELENLIQGLNNPSGQHFWLVIGPPELGKSWLLNRLSVELLQQESPAAGPAAGGWVARVVDLKHEPLDLRSDVELVLARLFGLKPPVSTDSAMLREIAQGIISGRRPYLCLLDSADLLDEEAAWALRACLCEIHQHVRSGRDLAVRLAFVVASRREDEWLGVSPQPRLRSLPLTEFKIDIVRQALADLAQQMRIGLDDREIDEHAARVFGLTEGLPALLASCLRWISREGWTGMDRLASQGLFEELARPYIGSELLSAASLFPTGGQRLGRTRRALQEAFRVLAPYRLITMSHLSYQMGRDDALKTVVSEREWDLVDLWDALGDTALLVRPLDEPWRAMHPPMRRLLFRYFYPSERERAAMHRRARRYVEMWREKLLGDEQVRGMVECLWHEAARLAIEHPDDIAEELIAYASQMCDALEPSQAYTVVELRRFAQRLLREDQELQDVLNQLPGLFERLVGVFARRRET